MRSHIDWLTFTMTMRFDDAEPGSYPVAVENAFHDLFDAKTLKTAFGGEWDKNERSRAPYTDAWKLQGAGITLFASPTLTHCCVEISGEGCERLIELEMLEVVLRKVSERVTRLDVASDIQTDTRPRDFVAETTHERMRTSGYVLSETGETCYVGSQKSERYARVYRYAEPHPRASLLRIEHVFRRDYAKVVARRCVDEGIDAVASAAGLAFGWSHSAWQPMDTGVDNISVVGAERKMGKTLFWLIKACAPAFKRLVEEGVIREPEKFLTTYFLPEMREE